ncbi:MAG: hypothetical protein N3F09_04585 [Bacteroidia bacterium]|nr:hypothetical protein [Bacteroidia bacterium]
MQKFLLQFFFLLYFYFTGIAQINIRSSQSKFSVGNKPCLQTEIKEADDDFCRKEWNRFLEGYKTENIKKSGNEIFADNVTVTEAGNNPADIYAAFDYQKKSGQTTISWAVDLGGAFLNPNDHADKIKIFEALFKRYASATQKKFYEKKLENQKEEWVKCDKKIKNLSEDNTELNEKIFKWENEIKKNDKELSETKIKLESKKKEVEAQKKVVSVSSGAVKEQQKSSEKILEKLQSEQNDLEKDIKRLEKENESNTEKIKNAREKIKKNEEDIQNLRQKAEVLMREIQTTEAEIKKY